jgi:hypothetical protein
MVCEPIPLNTTPVSAAVPALKFTGAPPFRDIAVDPTVSVKDTAPVGTVDVWPAAVSDTVAVIVAVAPFSNDVGLTTTAVEVVSPGVKPVPLTETACVLLATLSVLFVSVIPALRLPTDCGVNCTDTLQTVPEVSEVAERHWLVDPVGWEKSAVNAGSAAKTNG